MTRFALTLCLAAAAVVGHAGISRAGSRVDVPVKQTVLPNGDTRYSVPVTVGGGAPIDAELDTGSFGLRVLAGALKPGQYEATDIRRVYAFGGGTKFDGVLARASVGVGPVQTTQPILIHVIQSVGCVEQQPKCFASRLTPENYRIAGDGYAGQGFDAILGLSMRRAATDDSALNPLTTMGDQSWILILPLPGSGTPGHLIIDPDDQDRAGFALLKLKPEAEESGRLSGWADATLSGCLREDGGKPPLCGKTVLDSGAPGIFVGSDDVRKPAPWSPGTKGTLVISGATAPVTIPVVAGGDWSKRVVVHPLRGEGGAQLSAGTLPFFSYAVLYDARTGTMGFKPRDPVAP